MQKILLLLVCVAQGSNIRQRDSRELSWWNFWKKPSCEKVTPLGELDLTKWTEKSWYIHEQQTNGYQSADQLFCVTATYGYDPKDEYIRVDNYGNNGEVNGPPQVSGGNAFSDLCAKQKAGGDLLVSPCFFSNLGIFDWVAGPYWVLAAGENYEWAIVSGGLPKEEKPNGTCTTKQGTGWANINGSGLWLFTREPERNEAFVEMMKAKLDEMKIFTGDLLKVEQEGCNYEGATLK